MRRQILILLTATIAFSGCGKKSDDGGSTPVVPEKSTLLFPSQNSACTTATIISDTQSSITLSWAAAANAESYDVVIKDLSAAVSNTQNVKGTQLTVTLTRGVAYSWYVVSKSSQSTTTAQTDTWKFFNPAPGAVYYAPFPADLLYPAYNGTANITSGKVALSWQGSDPDNDIVNYNIYVGPSATNLTLAASAIYNTNYAIITTTNTRYYWKIVTTDAKGNTSDSPVYYFTTN